MMIVTPAEELTSPYYLNYRKKLGALPRVTQLRQQNAALKLAE